MTRPIVKGLFIRMDGTIWAENIPIDKREVEFLDGSHPFLPSAIYHDIDHKEPPLYIVWQGRPMPEGFKDDSRNIEESLIKEATHMTMFRLKPLISRRWTRAIFRWSLMFIKILILTFAIVFSCLLAVLVIL